MDASDLKEWAELQAKLSQAIEAANSAFDLLYPRGQAERHHGLIAAANGASTAELILRDVVGTVADYLKESE